MIYCTVVDVAHINYLSKEMEVAAILLEEEELETLHINAATCSLLSQITSHEASFIFIDTDLVSIGGISTINLIMKYIL